MLESLLDKLPPSTLRAQRFGMFVYPTSFSAYSAISVVKKHYRRARWDRRDFDCLFTHFFLRDLGALCGE